MIIVNRTHARAEALATRVGAESWPLERLQEALVEADVVASAVLVAKPLLTRSVVEGAMRRRTSRHLAVLDLGMPRNVAEEVNGIVNVFLNDIETLKQVVDTSLQRRRKEVPRVEGFIHEEIGRLLNWQRSFQAGPLIGTLRAGLEEARRAEVMRVTRGMAPAELEAVDRATRAVINKLAHGPMKAIHAYAREAERGAEGLDLIRSMFENLAEQSSQDPSEPDVAPS
jgi:glutamyl-tRNA reductase